MTTPNAAPSPSAAPALHRLCVAPMMDWTDTHCRSFHRLLAPNALLYTEMVTTGALLHGDVARHLRYDASEHPLALQLGGSDPEALARCAELAATWQYDEVNLNCGCPSDRVQEGSFGACLMRDPQRVAASVAAMRRATDLPVTVKHRIGVDDCEDYAFMKHFVETVAAAGCTVFIVHARKAWLQGLSPRENREIPPLTYEHVYRLKQEFPQLTVVINGGIRSVEQCRQHLLQVDGVMIGREAYENPYSLAAMDAALFTHAARAPAGDAAATECDDAALQLPSRDAVLQAYRPYVERQLATGTPLKHITRHLLGLYRGQPGGRQFRRTLSERAHAPGAGIDVLIDAIPVPGGADSASVAA